MSRDEAVQFLHGMLGVCPRCSFVSLSSLLKVFSSGLLINMSYYNVDAQELRTNSNSKTGSELATEAVATDFL